MSFECECCSSCCPSDLIPSLCADCLAELVARLSDRERALDDMRRGSEAQKRRLEKIIAEREGQLAWASNRCLELQKESEITSAKAKRLARRVRKFKKAARELLGEDV